MGKQWLKSKGRKEYVVTSSQKTSITGFGSETSDKNTTSGSYTTMKRWNESVNADKRSTKQASSGIIAMKTKQTMALTTKW